MRVFQPRRAAVAVALAWAGLCGSMMAHAGGDASPAALLGVDELARLAIFRAPAIQVRAREVDAAEYGVSAARWGRFPSLSVSGASHAWQSSGASGGTQPGSVVKLEQTLYAWGGIEGRIQAAEQQRDIAELARLTEINVVLDRLITAFGQFQQAQERIAIQRLALARLRDYQAMIARRRATQLSSANDEALVLARVFQTEADIATTESSLQRARALIEELTFEPVQSVRPGETTLPDVGSLPDLEDSALRVSPELASARLQREVADTEVRLKKADMMPRLIGRVQEVRSPTASQTLSYTQAYIGVEASLTNGLSQFDGVRQSVSRMQAAEQQIQVQERNLRQLCLSTWADANNYSVQIPALAGLVQNNGSVVESFMRQYIAGKKSWLDVLNAERELTQSQLSQADVRAQIVMAGLRLRRLTGHLPSDEAGLAVGTASGAESLPAAPESQPTNQDTVQ